MRISDWSSDVCSSDLLCLRDVCAPAWCRKGDLMEHDYWLRRMSVASMMARKATTAEARLIHYDLAGRYSVRAAGIYAGGDRKSVVEGKSVSVRVDSGGRRITKKKKKMYKRKEH